LAVFWFESLDSDGAAAKLHGDRAALLEVAAAFAPKLSVDRGGEQ